MMTCYQFCMLHGHGFLCNCLTAMKPLGDSISLGSPFFHQKGLVANYEQI